MDAYSTSSIASSNSDFSNKLYQVLSKEDRNIIFSPISAHVGLALLYQAASGDTAKCLKDALNFVSAESVANEYKNVMNSFSSIENISLHFANKIFVHDSRKLKDSFKSLALDYFSAGAENINFADKESAAEKINKWVDERTRNQIKKFFNPNDLGGITLVILVNAIYFHGDWQKKFNKLKTKTEPFFVSEDNTINCDLMHSTGHFDYLESADLDAKVLKIPYENPSASFIAILPNARKSFRNLEEKLASMDIRKLMKQMNTVEVEVFLPRFRIELNINLKEPLTKVGLGKLFENAEVPDMFANDEPIQISDVIQKAVIDVYEEGTVAAAASAYQMCGSARELSQPPKPIFRADRPFIFYIIVHDEYILFHGKIVKPDKSSFRYKSHDEMMAMCKARRDSQQDSK